MNKFSHENFSVRSIEEDRIIDYLHKTIEKQKLTYQPKVESFYGKEGYTKSEIERDLENTKRLKQSWDRDNSEVENRNKKISDVFEGVVVDMFSSGWLGENAQAFYTAEPDDILRGVDCIVEINTKNENQHEDDFEHLGLGIDVTFSEDYSVLEKKLEGIWSNIDSGILSEVKYVETDNMQDKLRVCKVIISSDRKTVFDLSALYAKKDIDKLKSHNFSVNALLQIKYQLESYYNYAHRKGVNESFLRTLTETLAAFYEIYDELEDFILENVDDVLQTKSFKYISDFCDKKVDSVVKK